MTLVVSEVSTRFGCVLVGDSAVTVKRPGQDSAVRVGAAKIHYSAAANIGFAIWGNATFADRNYDAILDEFVGSLAANATPSSAGEALADLLAQAGTNDGRPWAALRSGAHVAGYENGYPALYHVHTGRELPAPQYPHQLHKDFQLVLDAVQLRNGFYPMFAALFPGMRDYAVSLSQLGFRWPFESIEDRVSFYEIAVRAVSDTLMAAGRLQAVGGTISAVAFNQHGLKVDKRLAVSSVPYRMNGEMAEFCARLPNAGCN